MPRARETNTIFGPAWMKPQESPPYRSRCWPGYDKLARVIRHRGTRLLSRTTSLRMQESRYGEELDGGKNTACTWTLWLERPVAAAMMQDLIKSLTAAKTLAMNGVQLPRIDLTYLCSPARRDHAPRLPDCRQESQVKPGCKINESATYGQRPALASTGEIFGSCKLSRAGFVGGNAHVVFCDGVMQKTYGTPGDTVYSWLSLDRGRLSSELHARELHTGPS